MSFEIRKIALDNRHWIEIDVVLVPYLVTTQFANVKFGPQRLKVSALAVWSVSEMLTALQTRAVGGPYAGFR